MKNYFKNLNKTKKIILVVVIIAIVAVAFLFFGKKTQSLFEITAAKKQNIVQKVSVTGTVKPAESVDLAVEKSGRVARVHAKVGDKISTGSALVVLENGDLVAQLKQYQANLEVQQAKLDELKIGTRPEEIKIQETRVENAKTNLTDARQNLTDKLNDAYTKADDSIRNKIDLMFNNPRTSNPQIAFPSIDSQLKIDIESGRFTMENILTGWDLSLEAVKSNLNKISVFLDKMASATNALLPNSSLSQTTIDTYKSNVFTARTNINTAITNLSSADEKLKTAESTLAIEENTLALKKAGYTSEQIAGQEAQVKQAEANVENIEAQLAKTIIRAPITGIITKQEAKVGEIMAAGVTTVSIISEAEYQIEANVAEADIAKIKIGNSAKVTLDAYGNDVVFEVKVVTIDPAETIVEGVATYKTTLQFMDNDSRIKSGMTANIDIVTAEKQNIVAIPSRAVISKDSEKIVRVPTDEKNYKEIKVKTGLIGSDGNIEILEGINEGDEVIVFIKNQ